MCYSHYRNLTVSFTFYSCVFFISSEEKYLRWPTRVTANSLIHCKLPLFHGKLTLFQGNFTMFFTAHFLTSRHTFFHGALSFLTAHFLSSRHTFLLDGTLSFFHGALSFLTAQFLFSRHTNLSSRRTFLLHSTLSYFTAQYRDREIVVRILDFSQCENLKRGQENRGPLFSFGPCCPCFRPGLS